MKWLASQAISQAASSPIVWMPSASSRAPAFGPMPLIRRTGSGQMRVGRSARVSTVRPSGLSSSEAIFDSSLLGVTPIEQVSPVTLRTLFLMSSASARTPPSGSWAMLSRAPATLPRSM